MTSVFRLPYALLVFMLWGGLLTGKAPAQVPDTLDPRGYFPLQVGHVWEYNHSLHRPPQPRRPQDESERRLERYRILDRIVQGDTTRFMVVFEEYTEAGDPIRRDTSLIWYDETTASIEGERPPGVLSWLRCLDAPYGTIDDAPSGCEPFIGRYEEAVFGEVMTVKSFGSYTSSYEVVHGIGIVSGGGGCEPCTAFDDSDHWSLVYARVGGKEYGTHIVRVEQPDGPAVSTLSVYPNPIRSQATVEVPHAGRLIVFDLLGRQVDAVKVNRPGTIRLDASTLAPGLYLLRFEHQTATVMVH